MTTDQATPADGFHYGDLAEADAQALELHAENIAKVQDTVRRVGAEGVITLGKELKAAQSLLASPDKTEGTFNKWIVERCGFSKSSAYNALAAFKAFGSCPTVGQHFDCRALYLLSADSCPEEATKEAVRLAKKGEQITHKRAKAIKGKHTGASEPAGFDYDKEVESLVEDLRRRCKRWPADHQQAFAQLLRQIANEVDS